MGCVDGTNRVCGGLCAGRGARCGDGTAVPALAAATLSHDCRAGCGAGGGDPWAGGRDLAHRRRAGADARGRTARLSGQVPRQSRARALHGRRTNPRRLFLRLRAGDRTQGRADRRQPFRCAGPSAQRGVSRARLYDSALLVVGMPADWHAIAPAFHVFADLRAAEL